MVESGYVSRRDRRPAALLSFSQKEDQLIISRSHVLIKVIIECNDGPDFKTAKN